MMDLRGEPLGEHSEPASDLQHDVVSSQRGQPGNHVEDVAVDEEVLTELPGASAGISQNP